MSEEVFLCKRCGAENSPRTLKCWKCHGSLTPARAVPVPSGGKPFARRTRATAMAVPASDGMVVRSFLAMQQDLLGEQRRQTQYLRTISTAATVWLILTVSGIALGIIWIILI
jgi:hypothetical protein